MWRVIFFILALFYALMPVDLIPDALVGWGWIDDLIILGFVLRYLLTGKAPSFFRQNPHRPQSNTNDNEQSREQQTRHSHKETGSALDPHEILGVGANASKDEIRTAYRKLANQYHPDKVQHLGKEFQELAEIKFKAIQGAYQSLMNKQ